MPGHWVRALRTVGCVSEDCDHQMHRGDPVYLVAGSAIQTTCPPCALRRFAKQPPADLPHLAPIATEPPRARQLLVADADAPYGRHVTSNWGSVERKAKGELARLRRQQRAANAVDGKLRQIGGDR
jgi:hypothetical protein